MGKGQVLHVLLSWGLGWASTIECVRRNRHLCSVDPAEARCGHTSTLPCFSGTGTLVYVDTAITNRKQVWAGCAEGRLGPQAEERQDTGPGRRWSSGPTSPSQASRGGHPPPHGHIDDDQQEQGEGRHATAHDERHGRHRCLLHVLGVGVQGEPGSPCCWARGG